jgi:outer membrane protein assembly factor BamB
MKEFRLNRNYFVTALVVLVYSYYQNPSFFLFDENYYDIVKTPPISPATQYTTLNSDCRATSQYRYSEKRTGEAPVTAQPSSQAKIIKEIYPFNVDIHSASKSSPTVDETGVYVGSDTGFFFKMDHDGNVLWQFYVPGSQNGIHGSAAVDEKKVYIGAYNGFLYALDKKNGDLVWANPVGDFIGASPLLADGDVFIAAETSHPNGLMARLDCNTGETKWVSQWFDGHSHASPTYDETNDLILAGANSGRFFAVDAQTGKTRWQEQLGGPIKGTAMIWDGTVYFSSWDKNYYAYDIKTGRKRWSTFMGGRNQTSLTLVPGTESGIANTKAGDITALNLNDGSILWRLKHGDPNHQFSILVTQDPDRKGEFLAWSRCKEVQLCILDGKTGKLIRNMALPGPFTGVPFAWKNRIYISLDKNHGLVILE